MNRVAAISFISSENQSRNKSLYGQDYGPVLVIRVICNNTPNIQTYI